MSIKKLKRGLLGFALGQAAILWHKDKMLQKKVAKAPTLGQKAKTFFDSRISVNKEIIEEVKEYNYEGTRDEVKSFFHKEVEMIEDKMIEFENKVAELKEKTTEFAQKKTEEVSTMISDHLTDVQTKLKGKWDDVNEKYQVEEKVKTIQKHYDQLKKQLNK